MCTSSGRKAAQEGLTAQRRAPSRMVSKAKFVGGQAALYKNVSVAGSTKQGLYNNAVREEGSLGAEAGGSYIDPARYGGTSVDTGGEANNIENRFSGNASEGVSGMNWTGASGRTYSIRRNVTERDFGAEAGTNEISTTYAVGQKQTQEYGVKDKWNVGSVQDGVDIGKTEDEARKTYADFGMDFDKDKYSGDFYKTTQGLSNGQRTNVQAQEGARRKLNRIRGGAGAGAGGATTGNARRKAKKQGSFRISSSGIQGGTSGGGTTLS